MRNSILPLLCLYLTIPASAFVHSRSSAGQPLRRGDSTAIRFLINQQTEPGLINSEGAVVITADSDPIAALQAAMDAWTNVETSSVAFAPPDRTSQDSSIANREHILSFVDTPNNRSALGDAIAVTFTFTIPSTGEIVDTDILFNPRLTFSTTLQNNTYDIQSVAVHELGHALGAGHSGLAAATMYFAVRRASNATSVLSADDVAFVTEAYPESGVAASFGSISGSVLLNGGGPAVGALVAAIDPSSGIAVGSLTASDGTYSIAKLPPGRYIVYTEPMDGPVLKEQLGNAANAANTEFSTAILGGAAAPESISVSAGQNATADLTVEAGTPTINIQGGGVAPVGAPITLSGGAAAVRPGEIVDFAVFGRGLDDPTISEDTISFFGASITIRKGSLRRGRTTASNLPIVALTVQVGAPATGGGPAPVFSAAGVVNAASFLAGPVAPGEIVSIFGTGLGPAQGVSGGLEASRVVTVLVRSSTAAAVYSAGLRIVGGLSTTVADVTVTFNGVRAPLFFVSQRQINTQVPFELAGQSDADIVVTRGSASSATGRVPVAGARPGIFVRAGTSQGILLNQDGAVNGANNPAPRGSVVVIFATGQGVIGPALLTGQLAPASPLSRARESVSARIGSSPARVLFAGMAPHFVGLLQVNAEVPADAPTGPNVSLTLNIGGVETQPNVTLAVR